MIWTYKNHIGWQVVHGITHLFVRYYMEICFEGFIINAITDRYNSMCYIDEYQRYHQSSICDDGSSGGGCPLTTTSTTEAL